MDIRVRLMVMLVFACLRVQPLICLHHQSCTCYGYKSQQYPLSVADLLEGSQNSFSRRHLEVARRRLLRNGGDFAIIDQHSVASAAYAQTLGG